MALEGFFFHEYLGLPAERLSVIAKVYQQLLTLGYRPTIPRSSTIVTILARDPHESVCGVRRRLQGAIKQVLLHSPRGILVAVTLQDGIICPNGETAELMNTVQGACASTETGRIPVVFGHDFVYEAGHAIRIAGESIVPIGRDSKCGIGHTATEPDFRRLPLELEVMGQWYPSLSWRAVELLDDSLVTGNHAIASGLKWHSSLYTSLFVEKDFEKFRVSEDALYSSNMDLDGLLRGRFVVLGMESERPASTNIGQIPVHVLHAAYLEAYLDGRVLRNVSPFVYWGLAVVFWTLVEVLQQRRGLLWAFLAIAGGFIFMLVVTVLLVHFVGFYSDFPTISMAGLFAWLSNVVSELRFKS